MFSKKKLAQFFKIFHNLEISWEIYTITLVYLIITVIALVNDWRIGLLLILLFIGVAFFLYINMEDFLQNINSLANDLSKEISQAHQDIYNRGPLSILFYDNISHRIKWLNPSMQQIIGQKDVLGEVVSGISDEISKILEVPNDRQWHVVAYGEQYLRVLHQEDVGRIFMLEITSEVQIKEQRKNDQIVFGYLLLDDYSEIIEAMDDQQAAIFDAVLFNKINDWTAHYGIFLKRLDEERFILLMNTATLDELERNKFRFFEELRKENYQQNILISSSLGLAYPGPGQVNYRIDDLAKQAQLNLDLALGRGGDQIVVRSEGERARFYGGKTQQEEKRSNIRSKIVFQALQTQIEQASQVFISGHKTPDLDSLGSSLAMHKIVRQYGREAHIIVKESDFNADIKELLSLGRNVDFSNIFTAIEDVKVRIDSKSLLILLDHHRPSISEAEEIIGQCDTVVIDHHRRGEEFPENTVLSYIEPYASSTAELITEFIMNFRYNKEGLTAFESTALLAGIIIDTNNFSARTGSKTFDTASFLKSRGAQTDQIQRLQKEDFASVKRRNALIEATEIINGYGITKADNSVIMDNVIASQAVDKMLEIKGIEASFVIYRRDAHTVAISARSLGKVNVQVIMEKMGGGGHLSNAATQITEVSVDSAYQQLIKEIRIAQED